MSKQAVLPDHRHHLGQAIRNEQGEEIGRLSLDDGMAQARSEVRLDESQVERICKRLKSMWHNPMVDLVVISRYCYIDERWLTYFFDPGHYPFDAKGVDKVTGRSVTEHVLADLYWLDIDVGRIVSDHPWLLDESVPQATFVSAIHAPHITLDKWDMIQSGDFGYDELWADAEVESSYPGAVTKASAIPAQPLAASRPAHDDLLLTPCNARVYDVDQVGKQLATIESRHANGDARKRMETLYKSMIERGEHRCLIALPDDLDARIARLRGDFPNFGAAIDLVSDQLALQRLGNRIVHFEPMLLLGSPGIGKTYFAEALARTLGTDYRFVHMEAEQNGATLAGSSEFWSNTRQGELFEYLVHGGTANPLFVVDELDKVNTREFDARAALYQLLEKETARRFRDLSVSGIELDASHVLWIMTANEIDTIPAPLLSRMQVVDVPSPTHAQGVAIASRIYVQLRQREPWGAHFSPDLSPPVAEHLARISPRQLKTTLMRAFGRAATLRRSELALDDIVLPTQAEHRPIGFHP